MIFCILSLAAPALATMPAREDVYPQVPYSGMQIRDINFSGVTITSSYEPQNPPEVKTFAGRIEGSTVRVTGTIIYNGLDPGEWSVTIRSGDRAATNGSAVKADNLTTVQSVPFDVVLDLGPGATESGIVNVSMKITTHRASGDASVETAATFYGSAVPTPVATPLPAGSGFLPAILLPIIIAGIVLSRGRKHN